MNEVVVHKTITERFYGWIDLKRFVTTIVLAGLTMAVSTFVGLTRSNYANANSIGGLQRDVLDIKAAALQHEITERNDRATFRSELRQNMAEGRAEVLDAIKQLREDVRARRR